MRHVDGLSGTEHGPREHTLRRHHDRADVRAVPGPGAAAPSAGGHGAWRRAERAGLGHDAGWPHGVERVFPARGQAGLRRRPGGARAVRLRRDRLQCDPAGRGQGPAADPDHRARIRLGVVPHRPEIRHRLPRHAVPGRRGGRVLQDVDPGPERRAAGRQSELRRPGRLGAQARWRRGDGSLGILHVPGASGAGPTRRRSRASSASRAAMPAPRRTRPQQQATLAQDPDPDRVRRPPCRRAGAVRFALDHLDAAMPRLRRRPSRRRAAT